MSFLNPSNIFSSVFTVVCFMFVIVYPFLVKIVLNNIYNNNLLKVEVKNTIGALYDEMKYYQSFDEQQKKLALQQRTNTVIPIEYTKTQSLLNQSSVSINNQISESREIHFKQSIDSIQRNELFLKPFDISQENNFSDQKTQVNPWKEIYKEGGEKEEKKTQKKLNKEMKGNENQRKKQTFAQRNYYFIFLIRRLAFSLICVFAEDYPFFQIQFLLLSCSLMAIFLVYFQPFDHSLINSLEIFNELTLMAVGYHLFLFTEFNANTKIQYDLGFGVITIIVFNIFINIFLNIHQGLSRFVGRIKQICTKLKRFTKRFCENLKKNKQVEPEKTNKNKFLQGDQQQDGQNSLQQYASNGTDNFENTAQQNQRLFYKMHKSNEQKQPKLQKKEIAISSLANDISSSQFTIPIETSQIFYLEQEDEEQLQQQLKEDQVNESQIKDKIEESKIQNDCEAEQQVVNYDKRRLINEMKRKRQRKSFLKKSKKIVEDIIKNQNIPNNNLLGQQNNQQQQLSVQIDQITYEESKVKKEQLSLIEEEVKDPKLNHN